MGVPATLEGNAWRCCLPREARSGGCGARTPAPHCRQPPRRHVPGSRFASLGPGDFGPAPADVRNRNQVWNTSLRGLLGAAKGCACRAVSQSWQRRRSTERRKTRGKTHGSSAPRGKFRPRRCPSVEVRTLAGQCRRVLGAETGGPVLSPLPSRPSLSPHPAARRAPGARAGHPLPSLAVRAELPVRHRPGPGAGLTCQPAPRLAAPNVGRGQMTDRPTAQPARGCWAAGQ